MQFAEKAMNYFSEMLTPRDVAGDMVQGRAATPAPPLPIQEDVPPPTSE